jgi:hypothetical protein
VRSVDADLLLYEIKSSLPKGFTMDQSKRRIVEGRSVTLTVRKPEQDVVFICRIIATINPVAKKIEFDITSGGDVNAPVEKFDEVAKDLKEGLFAALSKRSS